MKWLYSGVRIVMGREGRRGTPSATTIVLIREVVPTSIDVNHYSEEQAMPELNRTFCDQSASSAWYRAARQRNGVGHRLLIGVVLSTCMTLACSTPPGSDLDSARRPDQPREGTLSGLRADLARIAGRESVERGNTLLQMFRERGFDPDIQEFANAATDRESRGFGRNLIATVGDGHRDIVVGAHYDVFRLRNGDITGGAVDNGAAVVVLTRVAESLRQQELGHRVRVVLFDLEEVGALGSHAYVQAEDPDRIAAMVNVDVVAADGVLMYGPTAHDGNEVVYRSLRIVCSRAAIACMDFPQYPPSDDRSFQVAGIPNVSFGLVGAPTSHQLWLLLNAGAQSGLRPEFLPDLLQVMHTDKDTIERVSRAAMTRVHNVIVALVLELDEALQRRQPSPASTR